MVPGPNATESTTSGWTDARTYLNPRGFSAVWVCSQVWGALQVQAFKWGVLW